LGLFSLSCQKMRTTLFKKILLTSLILLTNICSAQDRLIALTIDDLPFVGESKNFHLNMIIDSVKASAIPATGFVIAGKISPENWELLRKFREAGFGLGNHTLTHANLNKVDTETYIQEIEKADKILLPVLTEPKYFRYPYLAVSKGVKKDMVADYLISKNYQVAPVTIDSKDFIFNQLLLSVKENERRAFLEVLKPCYLNYIWQQTLQAEEHNRQARKPDQTQILLVHANLLNAYVLPDIINLYKENGFTFVSLQGALKTFGKQSKPKAKTIMDTIDNFMAWD